MAKFIILTNNPLVRDSYGSRFPVEFREESAEAVLLRVRDRIHRGHTLLTHPLCGSVKPNETLFRSVMISEKAGALDEDSVILIEDALTVWRKFGKIRRNWREAEIRDFMLIDETLISSGIESAI